MEISYTDEALKDIASMEKDYCIKIVQKTLFFILLNFFSIGYSQETKFSRNSIKTGVGIGYNMGVEENALGTLSMIGYERSYGKTGSLRMNATLLIGGFNSTGISDSRDMYYRTTSWNINANYDFIKYRTVSLFIYSGGFANYSRGMLGSGHSGFTYNTYESERFYNLYFGANFGGGIRINPPSNRFAFEIKPLNFQIGNNDFVTVYPMFGVDIKIN